MYNRIRPAQTEEFHAGAAQDLALPLAQADALLRELWAGLGCVAVLGLAIGRWVLVAGLLYLAARVSRWVYYATAPRREGADGLEIDDHAPTYQGALFLAALPLVAGLFAGPVLAFALWPFGWAAESWSAQWHTLTIELIGVSVAVPAVLRLVAVALAAAYMWRCGLLSWRFSYEIVDPTYPAPRAVDPSQSGPRWPWYRPAGAQYAPPEENYPGVQIDPQETLRLIPVSNVTVRRVAVESPASGRKVPADLLRRFLAEGPADGFGERVWGKKSVGRESWLDCVAIFEALGIIEKRPNQPSVLVVTPEEAERRLNAAINGHP